MTRGNRGPVSPFRLVLTPEGGPPRTVPCARHVQNLRGAKLASTNWTADVGTKGTVAVEERMAPVGSEWVQVAIRDVVNGVPREWR